MVLWWLFGVVFLKPLPHPHLLLCLSPTYAIPQTRLDDLVGELGHGDLASFGFMVKDAHKEAGEGRGIVCLHFDPLREKTRSDYYTCRTGNFWGGGEALILLSRMICSRPLYCFSTISRRLSIRPFPSRRCASLIVLALALFANPGDVCLFYVSIEVAALKP